MPHSLTQDRLRAVLDYSIVSGRFYRISTGKQVGTITNHGYVRIMIDGQNHMAHRLAWLWVTGSWPAVAIDHDNVNRANNGFHNLREATKAQNGHNEGIRRNNTSGVKGVRFNKTNECWDACVRLNYVRHTKSGFSTSAEAAQWVCGKRETLHGSFANHG